MLVKLTEPLFIPDIWAYGLHFIFHCCSLVLAVQVAGCVIFTPPNHAMARHTCFRVLSFEDSVFRHYNTTLQLFIFGISLTPGVPLRLVFSIIHFSYDIDSRRNVSHPGMLRAITSDTSEQII